MERVDPGSPLAALGLAPATVRALERARIATVGALVEKTEAHLLKTDGINRTRLREIREVLAGHELCLGMRLTSAPEPDVAAAPTPEVVVRVLAGDVAMIDALAAGDAATWKALLEHLVAGGPPAAPALAIERMLAREASPSRWLDSASQALFQIESSVFTTALTALRAFLGWFGDGIVDVQGATAAAAIEVRFLRELRQPQGLEAARSIAADADAADVAPRVRADALVLLARRHAEADDHAAALDALARAESALDGAADPRARGAIRRLRAASLFRLRRLDDAFAILDVELTARASPALGGTHVMAAAPPDRWDAALAEAATVATWAAASTPEWVRALGGVAERARAADKPALWQRFERALVAMVDGSANPGSDLEVVIRQATERRLRKTAEAARALAGQRGIELVDNVHFG